MRRAKRRLRQTARLHAPPADVVARLPPDALRAGPDRYLATRVFVAVDADAPCEERNQIGAAGEARHVEHARALEEERPLLGKEQREPRQVDLTDVGLGFGKIGIDGDRRVQIWRQVLED